MIVDTKTLRLEAINAYHDIESGCAHFRLDKVMDEKAQKTNRYQSRS